MTNSNPNNQINMDKNDMFGLGFSSQPTFLCV